VTAIDAAADPAGRELVPVLLARWEARAFLQDALEAEARERLAGELPPDELELLIEQQLATEQTEFLVEFVWMLDVTGCREPARMAGWIDRHNQIVARMRADLDPGARRNHPLGPQHKRKLWRLEMALFGPKARDACCGRLGGDAAPLVLALKDFERFMALHMDPTLCRDRLGALVQAGLLEDELQPNLRLFRVTDRLRAVVAGTLEVLRAGTAAPAATAAPSDATSQGEDGNGPPPATTA
jgi:hypothetical protein